MSWGGMMNWHIVSSLRMLAIVLTLGVPCIGTALAQGDPRASITGGVIEGRSEDGVQVFRGIPYAQAPVGTLRWRAPKPSSGWEGARQAADFGPACPQTPSRMIGADEMDEDCLTLNVWSPARSVSERLPVMVWIHGGGFRRGSSRMTVYDGRELAKEGVVLVTINYRLGLFGFFGHPELTREAKRDGVPTANFGLMDQIAALAWVKRNIGAFGGDAGNVTIFGESAGGASVLALMTSPSARGLFHKAIAQSGGGRWDFPRLNEDGTFAKSAYARSQRAIEALGVEDPSPVAALRRLDWRDVTRAQDKDQILKTSTPFVDGQILREQITAIFERGAQAQVPFMVGSTSYEGLLLRRVFEVPAGDVLAYAGSSLDRLADLYPERGTRTDELLADYIWGDATFNEPARKIARDAAQGRLPVYHYVFDYRPPWMRLFIDGTPHGLDVLYVFGSFDSVLRPGLLSIIDPENFAVSKTMRGYWTRFAKTGDPNDEGTPRWPAFKLDRQGTMVFGIEGPRVERDYLKQRLDIIEGLAR